MTNTKGLKVSSTMEDALVYLGRGVLQYHLAPEKRTLEALERRGLIEWSKKAEFGQVGSYRVYDVLGLWDVTLDGWAWLKANLDMDRPADEGRATLEEALADAEQMAADQAQGRLSLGTALHVADCMRDDLIREGATDGPAINWPDADTYRTEFLDAEALDAAAGLTVIKAAQALTDAKDAATLEREQNRPQWVDVLPLSSRFRTTQERQAADRELADRIESKRQEIDAADPLEQNPTWDEYPPLLPQRVPGVALATAVDLIRRLDQTAHALTLHQALAEAYTPTGQVTCKHGYGVADSCPGCDADQQMLNRTGDAWRATVGRQRGAGVWPEDARAPFVEHNALGQVATYRGVPVPADVADTWDSYGAVSWARGVESAHRDPGKFTCPVCHWSFRDSGPAENHFRGHFRNGGSRG